VLLTIKNFGGDVSSDMVGDIISENKRNSLAFLQVDMADHPFSMHPWFHFLTEAHRRARYSILFTVINGNVELQLDTLGRERDRLALETSWWVF
jgi:hypothetical protein